MKTKKYLHCHPADFRLEYTNFVKIGQPKLSESCNAKKTGCLQRSKSAITGYFLASRCKVRLTPRSNNDSGKSRRNQKA